MVARKKLDQWADLLLDTGKRNNLINFRDTKASTAEVLLPSPDVLFEKIDGLPLLRYSILKSLMMQMMTATRRVWRKTLL